MRFQLDGRISRNSHGTNETISENSSRSATPIETEMVSTKVSLMKMESTSKITETKFGNVADTSFIVGTTISNVRDYVASTDSVVEPKSNVKTVYVGGLSPRLEMRLALNRDIMGDEDLINYDPGPDLTAVLGHDLSTYRQLTPRDILNRTMTANRSTQPKQTKTVFLQQKNSKMDTPTPNRKKTNLNTWSSSVSVDQG